MALHAMATHFKYGIQRPPWQRHELSSVISLSFLDVYGHSSCQYGVFVYILCNSHMMRTFHECNVCKLANTALLIYNRSEHCSNAV